ncbi:MAG: DinB family protein [Nocardioides sp.]|nr:DinB family protein [Nocardioides sp.]
MATETHRHAGHADILREMVDRAVGFHPTDSNMPGEGYDWPACVAKVQASADAFRP